MTQKLFLFDAMAMIYRAYFALIGSPMINSKGKNVSAIYGFINSIVKIIEDEDPNYIAICSDTEKPTFRHKMFPQYKAQRMEIPTDMPWQIEKIKDVIKAMGIPLLTVDGYEADDIIGTLVKRAEKEKVLSYMVTPDKDFMQLVTDKIFLYKPARVAFGQRKDVEIVDIAAVRTKFGITDCHQVIDMLGLMGDTSDNVPGVKGIGEKTAMALIQEFGSIENIYKNIDRISKPKLKENLLENKEMAFLCRKLVTIETNAPVKIDFHTLKRRDIDQNKFLELLTEFEFKSLIKKFSGQTAKAQKKAASDEPEVTIKGQKIEKVGTIKVDIKEQPKIHNTIKNTHHDYYTIKNVDELKRMIKKLSSEPVVCFDTETDNPDATQANIVGMSFAYKEHEAYYVPVYGNIKRSRTEASLFDAPASTKDKPVEKIGIEINEALKLIKPFLEDKKIKFVGQNIKYDYIAMKYYGIEIANMDFDTLIGAFILRPEGAHDMDSLAEKYLNYSPIPITDLIGSGKNQITMDKVDVEKASEYASEDADVTLQLYHRIKYELEKNNLVKVCTEVEFPLIKVLGDMESQGVKIDEKILGQLDKEIVKSAAKYEDEIYKAAGDRFNINSPKQLAEILYGKLKLNPSRKTKTGFSTDVKVLEELRYQHPIAGLLVEYRTLTKLKSTYIEGLTKAINPRTGKVHTCFSQTVAATGRLSSVNPNLQNIPIRTDIGRSLRKAFVPSQKGQKMMSADYSQIELRIMAHYADDDNMINAFKRGHDIHTETSMRVFNCEKKDVTPNMRRKAKEVNFGIIYGIGAFGLASRLEIKNTEAKDIIERYFREYPKVRDYMERTKKFARDHGYVESLLGRRRYLSQINNQNAAARAEDERAAINMPIQGTAADMIKLAMIKIDEAFAKQKLKSKMLLQVHDELVFEVYDNEMEKVKDIVTRNMRNAIKLNVPIEVEVGVGANWYEAH